MKKTKIVFIIFLLFSSFATNCSLAKKFLPNVLCNASYFLPGFAEHLIQLQTNQNPNLLLFIGPPGSGKGTVGKELEKLTACKRIDIGAWLRSLKEKDPELENLMRNGQLIERPFITKWALEKIDCALSNKNDFVVLDGFPRTIAQSYNFLHWFEQNKLLDFFSIVQFHASKEFIEKYALNRASCTNCQKQFIPVEGSPYRPQTTGVCDDCGSALEKRNDDNKKTVAKRNLQYKKETKNSVNILQQHPQAQKINLLMSCTKDNPLCNQFADFKEKLAAQNKEL